MGLPKGYRHSDSEDSESEFEEEEPRGRGRPKASSKKPTAKKGRGRPKGGSKKVELPKGYASYDSEDFDFTSSEEELPEPKLSRSGRPIRPVFQNDDASGSEWEEADEYTVRYVKTGKPRGRKPKLNSAGEKTAKPKYVKTGTGKGRGRPPKRLAPMEGNGEELDEEAAAVPPKAKYVKTG